MSAILAILGMLSLFVGFFAASVTFYSIKEGDTGMALKSGAVLAACVLLYVIAPAGKKQPMRSHCYIDWDGRANAEVCN